MIGVTGIGVVLSIYIKASDDYDTAENGNTRGPHHWKAYALGWKSNAAESETRDVKSERQFQTDKAVIKLRSNNGIFLIVNFPCLASDVLDSAHRFTSLCVRWVPIIDYVIIDWKIIAVKLMYFTSKRAKRASRQPHCQNCYIPSHISLTWQCGTARQNHWVTKHQEDHRSTARGCCQSRIRCLLILYHFMPNWYLITLFGMAYYSFLFFHPIYG